MNLNKQTFGTRSGSKRGLLIFDKRVDLLSVNYSLVADSRLIRAPETKANNSTEAILEPDLISLSPFPPTDGQSDVEVDLIAKKYVERGSSVTLICKHNVEPEKLYKVTWLKGNSKVFEYINGRQPPYRNFSVPGAEIDVR